MGGDVVFDEGWVEVEVGDEIQVASVLAVVGLFGWGLEIALDFCEVEVEE